MDKRSNKSKRNTIICDFDKKGPYVQAVNDHSKEQEGNDNKLTIPIATIANWKHQGFNALYSIISNITLLHTLKPSKSLHGFPPKS